MTSKEKVFITGAGGFVGANLCRYFLARETEVVAISRHWKNNWRLPAQHPLLTYVQLDIRDRIEVTRFFEKFQPKIVINLAAYGAYPSQSSADQIYQVNMDAVRTMLESARFVAGFQAFIQAGSSSEYGTHCQAPLESDFTHPDSHYAVSKNGATGLCQFYAEKFNVPAWVLRLYSVYGPYEDTSRLIIKLLRNIQKEQLPPLVNPKISRDFVYVDDVNEAFHQVIQQSRTLKKGEVFNIGSGVKTNLEDLISLATKTFQLNATPEWGSMPDRKWDHPDWYSNPAKAAKVLNWKTRISLEDGLKQTMSWIRENQDAIRMGDENSVVSTNSPMVSSDPK